MAAALTFFVVELAFFAGALVVAAFFAAGADFLTVGAFFTVVAFFGATAFLAAVAFLTADFDEGTFFCVLGLAGAALAAEAGFFTEAGLSALASLTRPEIPLGKKKMPFSAPVDSALLTWLMLDGVSRTLNRRARYFLIAGRLNPDLTFSLSFLIASLIISTNVGLPLNDALVDEDAFFVAVTF